MLAFKIYFNRSKSNEIILFILYTIGQFLLAIIPEFIVEIKLFDRFIYFFVIPISCYLIFYFVIYIVLRVICNNEIKKYIKSKENLRNRLIAVSVSYKKGINEYQIKEKIKNLLISHNYNFKGSNIDEELNFFLNFIKDQNKN